MFMHFHFGNLSKIIKTKSKSNNKCLDLVLVLHFELELKLIIKILFSQKFRRNEQKLEHLPTELI